MLARLIRRLTGLNPLSGVDVLVTAELIADAHGTLTIRPCVARLGVGDFQQVVNRLEEAGCEAFELIHFDLSRVQELVGPWGAHFAMLVKLGNDLRKEIRMTGLHGQPAALAWLFRHSREVGALLGRSRAASEDPSGPDGPRRTA